MSKMRRKFEMMMMFAAMAEPAFFANNAGNVTYETDIRPKPKKLKQGQKLFFVDGGELVELKGASEYYLDGTDWILARSEKAAVKKAKAKGLIN